MTAGAATLIHSVTVFGADADAAPRADGWVLFEHGVVRDTGVGGHAHAAAVAEIVVDGRTVAGPGAILTPGLIDIHVHGGGGHAFDDGADAIAGAVAAHLREGTTRIVASLVSAPLPDLRDRLDAVARVRRSAPGLVGAHLEGPFLSPAHAGAHDPGALTHPDPEAVRTLLEPGVVRQVTVAPELPGAVDAIRQLRTAGVVAAVGHTHADEATARQAFDAGADLITHAFNAMLPLHHRVPGVVGAALTDPRISLEVIADGHHLHSDVVRLLFTAAPDRVVLVTDAMAAAGCADGAYRLGPLDVDVTAGVARLAGTDTIAGSTLTLAEAVRRVHAFGVPLGDAVRAATEAPARVLGLDGLGSLRPGRVADAVLLDASLAVRGVWQDGRAVA